MKKATEVLWSIRESLGFPVLRKPLIMMREMKLMSQVRPQYQPYQTNQEQTEPHGRESGESLPTSRPTLPIEPPKLPLPDVLKERIGRFRAMPIRSGIAEVLHSYSGYISSSSKRKRRKHEEEEEAYEERGEKMEEVIEKRLKRKGVFRGHSIEM